MSELDRRVGANRPEFQERKISSTDLISTWALDLPRRIHQASSINDIESFLDSLRNSNLRLAEALRRREHYLTKENSEMVSAFNFFEQRWAKIKSAAILWALKERQAGNSAIAAGFDEGRFIIEVDQGGETPYHTESYVGNITQFIPEPLLIELVGTPDPLKHRSSEFINQKREEIKRLKTLRSS